jgi:hypothetical protein
VTPTNRRRSRSSSRSARRTSRADRPHADGYRPICDPLWSTAAIFGAPSRPDTLLILSAARSLDTAHLQIERVRSGLTDIADGTSPIGSPAGRAAMYAVIGDAEHAMIALALVLRVIRKLDRDYDLSVSPPGVVMQKRRLIKRLRDHYSHVDERAFGLVRKKPDVRAEEAFEFGALLASRKFTDGKVSLKIDADATKLFNAARGYLIDAWRELVEKAVAEHGGSVLAATNWAAAVWASLTGPPAE